MPVIRVLVMLATMMMKLVKTAKEKKVFKNVGMSIMGIAFWEAIKDSIKKQIKKSDWICGNVKTADDYLKTHPNSWFNSAIGVTAACYKGFSDACNNDDEISKNGKRKESF
nr:phosphoenolpyruvate carboxykinase [Helicobacter pylori]